MNDWTLWWIPFWKWIYVLGLGSFFILVLAIIPLGARDLMRLFRHLDRSKHTLDGKQEKPLNIQDPAKIHRT